MKMVMIILLGLLAASSALNEEPISTNTSANTVSAVPVVLAVPLGQSTIRPVQTNVSSDELNLPPVQTTMVGATVAPSSPSSDLSSTTGSEAPLQLTTTASSPSEQTTLIPENATDVLTTTLSSGSNTELPEDKGRTFVSGFAAATGEDGRIYYVKNINGKVERGVLKGHGQLPLFDLNQAILRYFNHPPFYYPGMLFQGPNFDLDWEIRNAVNEYLQNLRL